MLGALLISCIVFGPLSTIIAPSRAPKLALYTSFGYLISSIFLLILSKQRRHKVEQSALISVFVDIIAVTLLSYAIPGVEAGMAMMLLFNIAATASLLRLRDSMLVAFVAGIATAAEYLWSHITRMSSERSLAELSMFIMSYLIAAFICQRIAQRARASQALAEQRTAEVENLAEINELIIRRMRTGVLVVDGENRLALVNEAAALLLGKNPLSQGEYVLSAVCPLLCQRLVQWRRHQTIDKSSMRLHPNCPEVQPQFVRLLADSEIVLIFLDDPHVVSRRVESLTLSTIGRFSASLAHEIRNPLMVIQHAAQLLEECETLSESDLRLPQIILQQCRRTNGIVDSVLGLARRERSAPENIDLYDIISEFVEEYRLVVSIENAQIEMQIGSETLPALFDRRQLHQVLTILMHNAVTHGHMPERPAHILLWAGKGEHSALIEITDNGPGISVEAQKRLFQPFFTTSEHGTGLGLYIANELCNANQARLEYHKAPSGGACFRLYIPTLRTWLPGALP